MKDRNRPTTGVLLDAHWYCDLCQVLSAGYSQDEAETLVAEHVASEAHRWRESKG